MQTIDDIRNELIRKHQQSEYVIDKTGQKVVEIIGATFIADSGTIVREPNMDYVKRELEWYESQSLYVDDIPGDTPAIWKQVASSEGKINSNYGYLIWSEDNYNQYSNVLNELKNNPDSRRATMIYTRPSIHNEYNYKGMSDFICTYANQFFIRDGKLYSHYIMRSNDAVFGYCNDYYWAKHVHDKLAKDLNLQTGDLIWTASSLHVYERHFKFLEG